MSQLSLLQREWPVVFDDYAKAEAVIYGWKMARERFVDIPLEGRSGAAAQQRTALSCIARSTLILRTFAGHEGDQSLFIRLSLNISGQRPHINNQAVDLQHPHQRIFFELAGQRPGG